MIRHYRSHLQSVCLCLLLLGFGLAAAAQEEKSLVLANHSRHAIWLNTVRYGDAEFPAGYLPPKGRIYLPLGTSQVHPLLLRWHRPDQEPRQQQTLSVKPKFDNEAKKPAYFIFVFTGETFIQRQRE